MNTVKSIKDILTPREKGLLELIILGYQRKKIAEKMGISIHTYDGYRKNIRQKLSIKSQADWMKVLYQLKKEI